jgi:hypothetical protein
MSPRNHPCRVLITACSHNISQRLHLYSQYSPPKPTNAGFPSNHDSGKLHPDHISPLSVSLTVLDVSYIPISNARGGRVPSFTLGGISAQPSNTNPFLWFHSTSNGSPPSHVSTTTCLDRYGGQSLSCGLTSTPMPTSTSHGYPVSPPHTYTVTIPIGPNVVNGEATFDTVKHGDDDSSDQTSPSGISAGEQENTGQFGTAMRRRQTKSVPFSCVV